MGGALFVEAPSMALLSSALFESNAVLVRPSGRFRVVGGHAAARLSLVAQVSYGVGYGGAVYVMSGRATLLDCTLRRNAAKIFPATGRHASGGAAAIGSSGSLELIGVRLLSNDAGGTGEFEFNLAYTAQAMASGIARAAHIDCAGQVTLVDSSILSPPASSSAERSELGVGAGVCGIGIDHRPRNRSNSPPRLHVRKRRCGCRAAQADRRAEPSCDAWVHSYEYDCRCS